MSEAEIISRILSGEEHLFARLVNRYSGYVWALCSSYIRNPSDCEDVAQEVFVQCYRRLNTLRNPAAFAQWLSQVARRCCLAWLRQSGRHEKRLATYERLGSDAEPVAHADSAPVREEMHEGIRDAINQLPPNYREALLLKYAEGYSVNDAAAFLGISAAAMRKRLERAQAMLKEQLWNQVEPALAKKRHREDLALGIVTAIPFGHAPWLGVAATTVAPTSNALLLGGIAIMSKKIAVGLGTLVLVALGLLWVEKPWKSHSELRPATVVRSAKNERIAPEKAGAPLARKTSSSASAPALSLAVADKPATVDEKATPAPKLSSISGIVTDQAGNPVPSADLHLEIGRDRHCLDTANVYKAKSSADGKYEIKDILTIEAAYLFASADGYLMQRQPLQLRAGANLKDVNFVLAEAKFYIAGKVVSENHSPVPDASVSTMYYGYDEAGLEHTAATGQTTGDISSSKFLFALTDKDGAFKVAIPAEGLCDLQVQKDGYGPGFFPKMATGTEDALLVLKSGGAIAGRVTNADGEPLPGTLVRVEGSVLPGGLERAGVQIQELNASVILAMTDGKGDYRADGLGEDYVYKVTVLGRNNGDEVNSEEPVRGIIAGMVADFVSGESIGAQKTDIHVKAGKTTDGVDLVVGANNSAVIRGVVTDRTSGKPVCPVTVGAGAIDGKDAGNSSIFQTSCGGAAVSKSDGSYTVTIQNLEARRTFSVTYMFFTEGGSAWEQPDEEVAQVELGPGDEYELDFMVDAPLVVPVRYVDTKGAPVEGIEAAMRRAGGRGGCGGTLISDADGRVEFHGIPPLISLQAVAWMEKGGDVQTLGVSEPFTGQPGETLAETTVVCRMLGGVEALFVYPDGRPVANTALTCAGQPDDGPESPLSGTLQTDERGAIRVADAIPEGTYGGVAVTCLDSQSGQMFTGIIPSLEIVANAVTNLGTVTMQADSNLPRAVDAANWGRRDNETIAKIYSKEMLGTLTGQDQLLKMGFALYDVGRYEDALEVFQSMGQSSESSGAMTAVAYVWQGHMLDLLGRREQAVGAYTSAAQMNETSTMRHDQFGLSYAPSVYAGERIQTPFTRVENTMP